MTKATEHRPYRVNFGLYGDDSRAFATFADALAFYETEKKRGGRYRFVDICNTDRHDGEGPFSDGTTTYYDGLTEEEREQL